MCLYSEESIQCDRWVGERTKLSSTTRDRLGRLLLISKGGTLREQDKYEDEHHFGNRNGEPLEYAEVRNIRVEGSKPEQVAQWQLSLSCLENLSWAFRG